MSTRIALAAAVAFGLLIASQVQGQTVNSTSTSETNSAAQAGSASGSAAIVNQTFTGPQQQRLIQEQRYGGTYTVRNTPDAYAPPITGGTNPCVVGYSGGGAVAGFGLALGFSRNDRGCELRNISALLHNQGQHAVAQEVLCADSDVRAARRRLNMPCTEDRAQQQPAQPVPPVSQQSPAAQPVAFQQTSTGVNRPGRPDWCGTVAAVERPRYPQCN